MVSATLGDGHDVVDIGGGRAAELAALAVAH